MPNTLETLKKFDLENATVALWTFKKTSPPGGPPKFNGRWIDTNDDLDQAIKASIGNFRNGIEEVQDYGILAQNNEASMLSIETDVTHASLAINQMQNELGANKVTKVKDINNSAFYVIKLIADGKIIYGFRRPDDSWKARKSGSLISTYFEDEILGVDARPTFNISKYIDFFVVDDIILISSKANFESVLNYKEGHKQDFEAFQKEPEFSGTFTNVQIIAEFVGENKLQLRRALAIKEKGHYKNEEFLKSLRQNCVEFGLQIQFTVDGKIIATPESCKDIFQALLDHRLMSHFSQHIYDVQNTSTVK